MYIIPLAQVTGRCQSFLWTFKLMMSQAIQGVQIPTSGNGQFMSEWIRSLLSLGTLFISKQYIYHLCAIALFLSHSIAFSAFATPTKINGLFTNISLHIKQIQILKCINMNYLVLPLLSPVLTSDTSTFNKHKTVWEQEACVLVRTALTQRGIIWAQSFDILVFMLTLFTYVEVILIVKYILSFLCTCLCLRLRYAYSYA